MANEAVIIELFNGGRPIQYTCANGTGIPKGTILEMTIASDRTVTVIGNAASPLVGIAASEKVASDGSTTIAAYTDGIFDVLTDVGTDQAGVVMANDGTANVVGTGDAADLLASAELGYLLEDSATNEVVAIRVNK